MENVLTSDFSDLGSRERSKLREMLISWDKYGLPDGFYNDEVTFAFNKNSGYVFFTNSDYQVAILNGDELEEWYFSPYEGHEGFLEDLIDLYPDMHPEDKEWFDDIVLYGYKGAIK